jgi:ATP-binding cassette subfamily B (MDR/TAP) protein 1
MNLMNSYSSLIKSSGAGDKVFALLDRSPRPPGTGSQAVRSSEGSVEAKQAPVSIQLEDVHFSYPSRPEHPVLKGINLEIKRGQTLALVGVSGCGKSTIVGLLQRLYDSNQGRVLVDSVDVKTLDIKAHR